MYSLHERQRGGLAQLENNLWDVLHNAIYWWFGANLADATA